VSAHNWNRAYGKEGLVSSVWKRQAFVDTLEAMRCSGCIQQPGYLLLALWRTKSDEVDQFAQGRFPIGQATCYMLDALHRTALPLKL